MNRVVRWFVKRKIRKQLTALGFPKKGVNLMLAKLFKGGQWVNAGLFLANLINSLTQAFPGMVLPPWVLALQTALGIFLPSVGGIAHQMAFGTPQDAGKK